MREAKEESGRNIPVISPTSLNIIGLFSQTWAKCKSGFFKSVPAFAKDNQKMVSFKGHLVPGIC